MTTTHPRKIRSFIRRPGRTTTAQQRALKELLPRYGIPFQERAVDLNAVFGRNAKRVLDIGFGDGEALIGTAVNNPDADFLGVEVHEPGVGHLLVLLEKTKAENVRVIDRDVVDVIGQMLDDETFDVVNLFFPDPWPKKRHHKRRLVQPEFLEQVLRILRPEGLFHIATDWQPYAEHVQALMSVSEHFVELEAAELCNNPLALRPPTKFERRGTALGHVSTDLFYRKQPRTARAGR